MTNRIQIACLLALMFACGDDDRPGSDASGSDTSVADTGADSSADTSADTTVADTGADTTVVDTGVDTGADTGPGFDGVVGDPCTEIGNCSGVLSCFMEGGGPTTMVTFPGGHCSTACTAPVDCPSGVCVMVEAEAQFCAVACDPDGDPCTRDGYTCQTFGAESVCLGPTPS